MKRLITITFSIITVLISTFSISSCIGEDIINDEIAPEVRILNPIQSIAVAETHQFNVRYFNNIGEEEAATISWSVLDESIATTSSYTLTGDFTIEEIENSNNLLLSIENNYQASTSLPGLYLYLTNNPNSINGALSLGPVTVFNGAHTYTIDTIGINDYTHLLYWCEPFGVKVGVGTIND